MAIPPLQSPWRAADLEAIRTYARIPVTEAGMQSLVSALNSVASLSPGTVSQCQSWISEIRSLESGYATQVAEGTAHLNSAKSYEGLRPGASPTREDMLRRADVVEWDTDTLYKVRIQAGDGRLGTATGAIAERISDLQGRVLAAVGLEGHTAGAAVVLRS